MKKVIPQIKLNDEEFKKLRKNKQSIILRLNDEDNKNINTKDKILLVNNKKKLKRKIKNLYTYSTIEEVNKNLNNNQLGYKKKDVINYDDLLKDYTKEEIKKYGLLGIEVNRKKHIFRKILLGLIIVCIFFFSIRYVNNKLDEIHTKKISGVINEVNKEKISYIFVEINPSLVMAIKDNKVENIGCLNDDCMTIYDELNIKGKNVDVSIDTIYNVSKEKGFDTSKGIKLSSSDIINVEKKDYITVEYIDTAKEKELLNKVKNNEDIKNIDNKSYYDKLWEELKKDSDYNEVYTCNMNDNKELECYITLDAGINHDKDYDTNNEEEYNKLQLIFSTSTTKILNTLKKFNFDVRDKKVYINNIEFGYVPLFTANGTPYKNALTAEIIDILDIDVCNVTTTPLKDGKCQIENGFYIVPLNKVNLVNPASAINNMVVYKMGLTDSILQTYEVYKMMNN